MDWIEFVGPAITIWPFSIFFPDFNTRNSRTDCSLVV